MKSRLKRHILLALLFPLLLGACQPNTPAPTDPATQPEYPNAIHISDYVTRVVDKEYGYICYTFAVVRAGGVDMECFKLDQ